MTVAPATKLIRINLGALTRVEWSAVVQVPADATNDELDQLVERFYEDIDGGDFTDDTDFWDKGECRHDVAEESATEPEYVVTRDADGDLVDVKANPAAALVTHEKHYASVAWTAEDVKTLFNISDERAEQFLQENESHIRDRLVELGWGVLETLGLVDSLPLTDREADAEDDERDDPNTRELAGGGCLQYDPADDTIRYIDSHGNTEAIYEPGSDDYNEYRSLFPVVDAAAETDGEQSGT